jgi:hypothetical protein
VPRGQAEGRQPYFAEAFIEGSFFKHNDPAANILGMLEGFSDKHNYIRMTPQAFSHFSYHQVSLMIVPLITRAVCSMHGAMK